mmetsp:Transcript_30827/g.75176  ORF Transcript_30827/g.75176 Transcript_30827/m.75176 type:complete len:658 (+) Transcript_30827:208-2181(+)
MASLLAVAEKLHRQAKRGWFRPPESKSSDSTPLNSIKLAANACLVACVDSYDIKGLRNSLEFAKAAHVDESSPAFRAAQEAKERVREEMKRERGHRKTRSIEDIRERVRQINNSIDSETKIAILDDMETEDRNNPEPEPEVEYVEERDSIIGIQEQESKVRMIDNGLVIEDAEDDVEDEDEDEFEDMEADQNPGVQGSGERENKPKSIHVVPEISPAFPKDVNFERVVTIESEHIEIIHDDNSLAHNAYAVGNIEQNVEPVKSAGDNVDEGENEIHDESKHQIQNTKIDSSEDQIYERGSLYDTPKLDSSELDMKFAELESELGCLAPQKKVDQDDSVVNTNEGPDDNALEEHEGRASFTLKKNSSHQEEKSALQQEEKNATSKRQSHLHEVDESEDVGPSQDENDNEQEAEKEAEKEEGQIKMELEEAENEEDQNEMGLAVENEEQKVLTQGSDSDNPSPIRMSEEGKLEDEIVSDDEGRLENPQEFNDVKNKDENNTSAPVQRDLPTPSPVQRDRPKHPQSVLAHGESISNILASPPRSKMDDENGDRDSFTMKDLELELNMLESEFSDPQFKNESESKAITSEHANEIPSERRRFTQKQNLVEEHDASAPRKSPAGIASSDLDMQFAELESEFVNMAQTKKKDEAKDRVPTLAS